MGWSIRHGSRFTRPSRLAIPLTQGRGRSDGSNTNNFGPSFDYRLCGNFTARDRPANFGPGPPVASPRSSSNSGSQACSGPETCFGSQCVCTEAGACTKTKTGSKTDARCEAGPRSESARTKVTGECSGEASSAEILKARGETVIKFGTDQFNSVCHQEVVRNEPAESLVHFKPYHFNAERQPVPASVDSEQFAKAARNSSADAGKLKQVESNSIARPGEHSVIRAACLIRRSFVQSPGRRSQAEAGAGSSGSASHTSSSTTSTAPSRAESRSQIPQSPSLEGVRSRSFQSLPEIALRSNLVR